MREALLLARSLGGDPTSRRIYLFTDGGFTLPPDLPEDLGSVEVVPVGAPNTGNLAVRTISIRPNLQDNRRQQLFARVENLSDSAAQAVVSLSVDGQSVAERTLEFTPNSKSEQIFEDLAAGARWASITVSALTADNGLALDDTAHVILVQRTPAQVLLVSAGNQFLEKVLTLLPNVDLYRIAAQRYLAVEADRFDIVVFDNYLPPLLPRGNLLVVNPADRGAYRTTGSITRARVATWDHEDPILGFADIRDLNIARASKLDMPKWAKPLISAGDGAPLLVAGQDGDRRVAIVPFDLQQSNLPLMSAFPILMDNLLNYLSPPGVVQSPEIQTGAAESLQPLPQVRTVRVTSPDGKITEFSTGQVPITFTTTDVPGLYRVQQIVQREQQTVDDDLFAANLTNPEASDIRPGLTGLNNPGALDVGLSTVQREFWGVFAAIVLSLLLFEWWWFHRRV